MYMNGNLVTKNRTTTSHDETISAKYLAFIHLVTNITHVKVCVTYIALRPNKRALYFRVKPQFLCNIFICKETTNFCKNFDNIYLKRFLYEL